MTTLKPNKLTVSIFQEYEQRMAALGWNTRTEGGKATKRFFIDKIEELIKAFGGCTLCYGKGYSTTISGTRISADFVGEKDVETPKKVHVEFCTCARGKQIANLMHPVIMYPLKKGGDDL